MTSTSIGDTDAYSQRAELLLCRSTSATMRVNVSQRSVHLIMIRNGGLCESSSRQNAEFIPKILPDCQARDKVEWGLSNGSNDNDLEWPWRPLFLFETFLSPIPLKMQRVLSTLFIHLLQAFRMWFFVQLCSSWHDFNCHSASRGPSAIAELLVCYFFHAIDLAGDLPAVKRTLCMFVSYSIILYETARGRGGVLSFQPSLMMLFFAASVCDCLKRKHNFIASSTSNID